MRKKYPCSEVHQGKLLNKTIVSQRDPADFRMAFSASMGPYTILQFWNSPVQKLQKGGSFGGLFSLQNEHSVSIQGNFPYQFWCTFNVTCIEFSFFPGDNYILFRKTEMLSFLIVMCYFNNTSMIHNYNSYQICIASRSFFKAQS